MKRRSSGVAEWACGISDLMFAQLPLALREEEGVQELQEFSELQNRPEEFRI
jgi:hypothetical protein